MLENVLTIHSQILWRGKSHMSSVSFALPAMCALHGVGLAKIWMVHSEEICVWCCPLWGEVGRYQSVKHIRKGLTFQQFLWIGPSGMWVGLCWQVGRESHWPVAPLPAQCNVESPPVCVCVYLPPDLLLLLEEESPTMSIGW